MLVNNLRCFALAATLTLAAEMMALGGETVEAFDIAEQENVFEERSLNLKAVSAVLVSLPQEVITLKQTAEPVVDEKFNVTFGFEYGIDKDKYNDLCTKLFTALDKTGAVNLGKYLSGSDDLFRATLNRFNDNEDSGWKSNNDVKGLLQALKTYAASGEAEAVELVNFYSFVAICVWRGTGRETAWKIYLLPRDVTKLFYSDLRNIECKAIFSYEGADGTSKPLGASEVKVSVFNQIMSASLEGSYGMFSIAPGIWFKDPEYTAFAAGPEKRPVLHTVNLPAEELRNMTGLSIELQRNRR